uniref:U3 small nucleolar RNA-associated protein 6 N-terminal domain-containing protein n=1 Tax=Pyricularia oryzae (strain P131) TaxID=1143193 RepID=L7IVZ0_PYRO1
MAGVADKARFFLEQAVPQLREFEDKEIFTRDEIRNLVRKRTDFEHRILAPGSKAPDFLAYADWERGLETLRARRCARLGIRQLTHQHAGVGRLGQIHERGVNRDPGSVHMWRSYLEHLSQQGAAKRWRRVATRAVRLHPQDAELWTLVGRRSAANGDMDGARAYFLRGCRFCTKSVFIWVEYARVEMEWLAKVESRGKGKKALAALRKEQSADDSDQIKLKDDSDESDDDDDGNMIPDREMAAAKALERQQAPKLVDEEAVEKLEKSPALGGAIPRAIFDIATKQKFFEATSAEAFFNMFSRFIFTVEPCADLIQHVLDTMMKSFERHPATWDCYIRQPLLPVQDFTTADFPRALRESLGRLTKGLEATDRKSELAGKTLSWVVSLLSKQGLDQSIETVLEMTKKKMESLL